MRYLVKFNELKSSTYRSAATKLKGLGHERRATELEGWVKSTEEREKIQRIKDTRAKWAHTGVFRCSILEQRSERTGSDVVRRFVDPTNYFAIDGKKVGSGGPIQMTGNFHIAIFSDDDMFYDRLHDYKDGDGEMYINFTVGIVPADDETEEWFTSVDRGVGRWDFYYDGQYTPLRPWSRITNSAGNFDPQPIRNETWESDRFVFEGRAEAMKFRKLFIDVMSGAVEVPYDPAKRVKEAFRSLPTPDKVMAMKRILPDASEEQIREKMVCYPNWFRERMESLCGDKFEEAMAMLEQKAEEQYAIFLEKAVKKIIVNEFYR